MSSNTGNATRNLPDLNTVQNDFEIAERLRRASITKLQKISNVVHELDTKKKILQGDITASKNQVLTYENLLLDLKNKTEITAQSNNKAKLEACSTKKYIEVMKEKLYNNIPINLPGDTEMDNIQQLQAKHDDLLQQKITLEEDVKKNSSKMKELQEILNNLNANDATSMQ